MSAVGNLEADTDADLDEEAPGLWESFGTALRLIVGWFCVAIGVLNVVVEFDRPTGTPDLPYLLFHGMLLIGGMILLALGWIAPRPGFAGYLAGGAVLVFGTLLSAVPATTTVCCLPAFSIRHGFPFTFVARDPGQRWHIDSQHVLADAMFWGYAGLIVLVAIAVLRGATGSEEETVRPTP
jgi:hypothetical protein